MSSIEKLLAEGWDNFTSRGNGPMHFRFVMQPAMAAFLAIRAGLSDARAGRPPFLWEALHNPAARGDLVRSGWKDIGKAFVIAAVIDGIYQWIVLHRVSVVGLLITATLLALVPYTLLRGPANRLARRNKAAGGPARPG